MIGQGAYGIVYKGKKEETGDIVAIKRIPFSDSTPEGGVPCNVIREISLLRELDHPNVVSADALLINDVFLNGQDFGMILTGENALCFLALLVVRSDYWISFKRTPEACT